jgi:precorrin-2 dehydrogenase / sirohydrochlorin ferrochelatase
MSYMVNLVVEGKSAVVIGGGEVAARKVQDLVAAQASVTVIALHPGDPIQALAKAGRIALHLRPYAADDMAGAFIAIAATDDEDVNRRVAADAARLNVLVNVVDRPVLCTFTAPATVRRGDLTLAVATQGRCPALAGILREELEQRYGPEYAGLVSLFGELRDRMIARGWKGSSIRATLTDIYRHRIIDYLAAGDRQKLQDFLGPWLEPEVSRPVE